MMTSQVVTVSPSQKLIDVKHIFEKKDFHHHIPVTENGRLTGMISLSDYLYAIKGASLDDNDQAYRSLTVKDVMSTKPVTRPPSCSVKEVAEELAKGEVHAVVIADGQALKGIVSTADIIRYLLRTA